MAQPTDSSVGALMAVAAADGKRLMIVTPQQYKAGYRVLAGSGAMLLGDANGLVNTESRSYALVRKLDDGNYLVVDPHAEYLGNWAQTPAEVVAEEQQGSTTPIPWSDPKDFALRARATLNELQAVQALGREAADPDQSLPQRHTGVFAYTSTESKFLNEQRRGFGTFEAEHERALSARLWPALGRAMSDGRQYVVQVETKQRDDVMPTRSMDIHVDQIKDPLPRIPTEGYGILVRTTLATVLLLYAGDAQVGEFVHWPHEVGTTPASGDNLSHTRWERSGRGALVRLPDSAAPGETAKSTGEVVPNLFLGIVPSIGSTWIWEPEKPHARQYVRVTDVHWNGEEWWVESERLNGLLKARPPLPDGKRYWNELSRWVEATVLVEPAVATRPEQLAADQGAGWE